MPSSIAGAGLWAGPILAMVILWGTPLDPTNPAITTMAALAVLMAVWWVTEAIPLAATALVPIALFPFFGIMNGKEVAALYFNHIIFLFIGGFLVALAMQRWNLHKRIALFFLLYFSRKPAYIILGFMLTTAVLSMWISNTATVMMMIPIALSLIINLENRFGKKETRAFSTSLLLGIAYGASIGGIATLVGTPPNLSFARIFTIAFPAAPEIAFATWFRFAFPLSITFLFVAWGVLLLIFGKSRWEVDKSLFRKEYQKLGSFSYEEKVVLGIFLLLIFLWLGRADLQIGSIQIPGWGNIFPCPDCLNDGVVAISLALLLFIIPSRQERGRLMDWDTAKDIPWDIVLLFGGGFALAGAFMESGLAEWIGGEMIGIQDYPLWLIIGGFSTMITFMTELTSNTATAEMILPVLAGIAVEIGRNPLLLMIPATLSCSFAFMMPVATPPNAIIFGTHRIRVLDMVKAGIILNLLGVVLITLGILFFGNALGIDPGVAPDWAVIP